MTKRKTILHIIISLQRGGCETALLRMLPTLQEEFSHTILTLQERGSLAPLFEKKNIRVLCLQQKNLFDVSSYFRLYKLLKKEEPDLIVTHLLHADMIGRLFIQFFVRCKVIASLVTTYNFKKYWPAQLFEKYTKYFAAGYMANADSVRQVYIEKFGVSPEKISVVPCGLDLAEFQKTYPATSARKALDIHADNFNIICVANLHPNKGHRYLLEAFEQFFQKYPASKLLIVGEGEEKATLLDQISHFTSREHILFLGRRADVPELLALSDVFVLPTFFEGRSGAIMEAMASGLPVITTDILENQELITDQETGLFCPLRSSACILASLELLYADSDTRTRIGENAARFIQKHYEISAVTPLWSSFFAKMIQK